MRNIFSKDVYLVSGRASPEDAWSTAAFPASASYIDVSGYEWVNVVIHLGAVHDSDTPIFELKQTDSASGTLDTISTSECKKTFAGTDDDQALMMYLETSKLAADHHFITCSVSGVSNGSYGDILYFLGGARHKPVTQSTTLVPTDNQLIHAG